MSVTLERSRNKVFEKFLLSVFMMYAGGALSGIADPAIGTNFAAYALIAAAAVLMALVVKHAVSAVYKLLTGRVKLSAYCTDWLINYREGILLLMLTGSLLSLAVLSHGILFAAGPPHGVMVLPFLGLLVVGLILAIRVVIATVCNVFLVCYDLYHW